MARTRFRGPTGSSRKTRAYVEKRCRPISTSSRPGSATATRKPGNADPGAGGLGPDAERSAQPTSCAYAVAPAPEKAPSRASPSARHTASGGASTSVPCSSTYGSAVMSMGPSPSARSRGITGTGRPPPG
ncbi:hypothetical protein SFUMM280S_05020 [Streptomyces fumanus]